MLVLFDSLDLHGLWGFRFVDGVPFVDTMIFYYPLSFGNGGTIVRNTVLWSP